MEKVIWKYPLELTGEMQLISMSPGAEFLSVQVQTTSITMWFKVDPKDMNQVPRKFQIEGTGHVFEDNDNREYLGTVQTGAFVWHIFEIKE